MNEAKRKCGMGEICGVFRGLRSIVGITEKGVCEIVGWSRKDGGEGC